MWEGGIVIMNTSGKMAILPINLVGDEKESMKQADMVRSFVETLWTMGIDARMLQWVRR